MGISGSLSTVGLPDVMQLLSTSSKTGTLEIRKQDDVCRLFFQEGNIVYATCDSRRDSLLDILVREKKLTPDRAEQIRNRVRGSKISLERALKETEQIPDEVLMQAAMTQSKEIVYELFQWLEGDFEFHEGILPTDDIQALAISIGTYNLIMEGARRIDEWSRIRKAIPNMDIIFRLEGDPQSGDIQFTKDEWRILALIDGRRSVRDICREGEKSEFEVCRILYGLKTAGIIREQAPLGCAAPELRIHRSGLTKTLMGVGISIILALILFVVTFFRFSSVKKPQVEKKLPVIVRETPQRMSSPTEPVSKMVAITATPTSIPTSIPTLPPTIPPPEVSHLVNINTADVDDLVTLPRIGPATARKIITFRETNGPFNTPHDITLVPGIGEKTYKRLSDKITVGHPSHPAKPGKQTHSGKPAPKHSAAKSTSNHLRINLNTATAEELTSLPGIGPSKAARIIEYRKQNGPFNDIHQITNVKGIGEKTFEKLKLYIYID